jgi:hypothetical protein
MERAFCILIEQTFQSAPSNLQFLKSRSYGHAYLCLAWKALQSVNRDHKLATSFQKKAIAYYPKFQFSKENLRLSVAITLMRLFGTDRYARTLSLLYKLRQSFLERNKLPQAQSKSSS